MNIDQITEQLMNLSHRAIEGDIKPSKAYSLVYQLEQAVKSIKKEIEPSVMNELYTYSKNDMPSYDGLRVTRMSRSSWSYDDSILDTLKAQAKAREKAMQQAYAHRQKHNADFITEDGEIVPAAEKKVTEYIKMEKVK